VSTRVTTVDQVNLTPSINTYLQIHIYLKNFPAKFHPDPIWNDRLRLFWRVAPTRRTTI